MEYFLIDIIRYYIEDAQLGVYGNTEIVWQDSRPQPTEQQIEEWKISYPHDISKQNSKTQAKQLIAKYDFAVLPDRSKDIQNIEEIIAYRNILLNIIKNPIENPEFPIPPEVVWK